MTDQEIFDGFQDVVATDQEERPDEMATTILTSELMGQATLRSDASQPRSEQGLGLSPEPKQSSQATPSQVAPSQVSFDEEATSVLTAEMMEQAAQPSMQMARQPVAPQPVQQPNAFAADEQATTLLTDELRQLNEREQSGALQGDAGAFESNTLEGLTGTLAGGMTSGPLTAGNPSGPLTGPIGMVTPKTSGPLRQNMMPTQMQQNLMNQAMNQQPQKSGVNKGLLIATIAEGVIILVLLGLLLF